MMEALAIINGERQSAYGVPEDNFKRIGYLWTAYLKAADYTDCIGPVAVCHMLDLVKLARLIATPDHEDSLRDRFGYNGCNVRLTMEQRKDDLSSKPTFGAWVDWPPSYDSMMMQNSTNNVAGPLFQTTPGAVGAK